MARSMPGFLNKPLDGLRSFTAGQRTVALIGVAILVLGAVAFGTWATKPSYTPLFSGLSAADANTIVEQLRTDGVDYELSNGGATILVPEEQVYDQRLKSAAAGLPSASTGGYSLLDDMGMTSSEFQQSVTYKRALEGELAATIGALDGVSKASVRLAIPEDTVFVDEKKDPTASVFVETESGASLNDDQVQAIVHLTSASIDGMVPTNVAVIDSDGTVLSAVGAGVTGSADKQSSKYEEGVRSSVQTMLDRVVGPGNATVVVAADMNDESAERVEETFTTPDGDPVLSETTNSEEYEGAGGAGAGVLGPDNIGVPDEGKGDGTFNSEEATRNNAINKVTESRIIPAGAIERQTVSVAIDAAAAANLSVADVTQLVTSAAGIDTDRGDEVTVEVLAFNDAGAAEAAEALAAADAAAKAKRQAELLQTIVIAAGVVLVILIILIVYALRSRRQRREAIDLGELQEIRPELQGSAAMALPVPTLAPQLEPSTDTTAIDVVPIIPRTPVATDIDRQRAEIDAMAQQDPSKMADYLRGMMDDRQPV
ncbi:flagellar basal-body MS-ring/collar protein FliF [Arthrobacter roseus]|uniref:flagellar basal-body MS-ring/collar protein FliF n=1 Tax=Arthrobacter roseus TaxID=136274 RepID=UPI0019628ED1|nr:flagellar basal-body MS-ring/collar protein FliF [Arthrobacter roseus]MBM7847659.1 flagellar M-ring protein FliF [Arthrobacter roseus]